MLPIDKPAFSALLAGCLNALYEKPVSPVLIDIWFNALAHYPLDEISAAFCRHVTDPDHGQFPPKPADIVRAIDGGGDGRALAAWTKVDKTLRCVGGWRSVCFDDALIHVCIDAMGGWIKLCETLGEELPFRQQEFAKRYRALLLTPPKVYPPHLVGRSEAANALGGWPVEPPLLIGDRDRASAVQLSGTDSGREVLKPALTAEAVLKRLTLPSNTEEAADA